jgi:hypothetical protein
MTEPTLGSGLTAAATASDAEYRIREMEARLDRRISMMEGRGGSRGLTGLLVVGLVLTWVALAVGVSIVVPRDGAWTMSSLTTEALVLRDADGVQRGSMSTDSDGQSHLALSDPDGRERIRLTVLSDGSPGVTISGPDAQPRAVLAYLPDGTTNLVFADAQGISRAVVGVDPGGATQVLFTDRTGAVRALVGVGADGEPTVSTYEERSGGGGP